MAGSSSPGQRTEQTSSEEGGVLIRESRSGAFRRVFALPEQVTVWAERPQLEK